MDKYLIINADDFGMSHSSNLAVSELLKSGGVTSATIMAPCAWSKEAVEFAKANKDLAIGVHLTTTSEWKNYRWEPVGNTPNGSLRDEEGFMHGESDEFEKHCDIEEVRNELIAQIEKLKRLGLEPSHLDNHMGSLYGIETGRVEILKMTFELLAEYKLPFRFPSVYTDEMFSNDMLGIHIDKEMVKQFIEQFSAYGKALGIAMPDYLLPSHWNGPQSESYENFREYIYEFYKTFEPGITETYIHPAIVSDELKGITGSWEKRGWEYKLFADPKTRQHIEACGIKLINYRDLQKMR